MLPSARAADTATAAAALQARVDAVRARLETGDYKTADTDAEALRAEVEAGSPPDSLEVAEVLALAAEARWRVGQGGQPATRQLLDRAIAIEERRLGPDDEELVRPLRILSYLQSEGIEYEDAKRTCERVVAIREKSRGSNDPLTALAHRDLAGQLKLMGDFAGARAEYENAVRPLEAPGQEKDLAVLLNNYALLFRDTGELARALELQQRALEIGRKAFGPDHTHVTSFAANLASIYRMMGRHEEALRMYERVLAARKATLGPEHPFVGTTLRQMGDVQLKMGRAREALVLLREALAVSEKSWGPGHPDVALALSSLAEALAASGDLKEARTTIERAVGIWESQFGPDHPDLSNLLDTLARCARDQGDTETALAAALRGEEISRSFLRLLARTLPEKEALQFAASRRPSLNVALSAAAEGLPEVQRATIWDSFLRTRRLVLDEMAARQQALSASQDPALKPLWDRFVAARQEWVDLIVRGAGERTREQHLAALAAARDASDKAEEGIAARSAVLQRERTSRAWGLGDVRRALPPDAALVAYVQYGKIPPRVGGAQAGHRDGDGDAPAYLAFVLTGRGVTAVPLGSAARLDGLVERWRVAIKGGAEAGAATSAVRRAGAALRVYAWDPVLSSLGDTRRVFVVPDGSLSLVNFAALPRPAGGYLIEDDRLLVHVLSSERDLVAPESTTGGQGLLALGNPAYDAPFALAANTSAAAPPVRFRGARPGCAGFQTARFAPLATTGAEVAAIAELLRTSEDPRLRDVRALTGADASETAFKTSAPGHRIVHLATHGFFLNGACNTPTAPARGIGGLAAAAPPPAPSPKAVSESEEVTDPLLLSGVALAGANRRAAALADEDDGILTAEEVASLDLTSVDWAVLSACDTGLGRIQPGEGVQGLSRALRIAGARTAILSLWPVEDVSARDFMTTLYRSRWIDHRPTAEAMREAALTVLRQRRREGRSDHPFFWAGFVAIGDWR
jgi:CHAT domain-containing protein/tetratricopeptide (TPR) repeat protein